MINQHGTELRSLLTGQTVAPFIGVYDIFSATVAARHFDGIFLSGFGFGASHYGLPDNGFNAWSDLVAFVQRVRAILPTEHLLVDIDDGFADTDVACHVVSLLEDAGASGVILEDQDRPRRCGHLGGKRILPRMDYMERLQRVLETRRQMVVVARTDASDENEILARVHAISDTNADAVLVDGLGDLSLLQKVRQATHKPLVFNQITGGRSRPVSLGELDELGVSLAIYSTPCLFAAQRAIEDALVQLKARGSLEDIGGATLEECNRLLGENLDRRTRRVLGAPLEQTNAPWGSSD